MVKKVLATTLKDVLIHRDAFIEAHRNWFEVVGTCLCKPENEIIRYQNSEDWQDLVLRLMKEKYTREGLEDGALIFLARVLYNNLLGEVLTSNPEYINSTAISKLREVGNEYDLFLVTDYSSFLIDGLLKSIEADGLYESVFASKPDGFGSLQDSLKMFLSKYTPTAFVTPYKFPVPNCEVISLEEFLKKF